MPTEQPWNLNIHYDTLLESRIPVGAQRVLDVGSGDGFLAGRLAQRIPEVTAVELDAPVLSRAQTRFAAAPIRWINGDVMTVELPAEGFDAVVSNAALHHIDDTRAALGRFAELVRPGGSLAVVTFVRFSLRTAAWNLATSVACLVANRVNGKWEHTAPIKWPPPYNLAQLRAHVRAVLPGARVRLLMYGRVLITWVAPG